MDECFADYAAAVTLGMDYPPKNYMLALEMYMLLVEDCYNRI